MLYNHMINHILVYGVVTISLNNQLFERVIMYMLL